jgi:hypothetical protein
MLELVGKVALLLAPLLAVLALYVATDPFKVIWHYPSYYPLKGTGSVSVNRDYISTEMYLRNFHEHAYDSFIFGNSRSLFYTVDAWRQQIGPSQCFHFDGSSESLYGIWCKVRFLDQSGAPLRNALLVMDTSVLEQTTNSTSHLIIKHPRLSGQSWLSFQLTFLKAFLDRRFLLAYLDYRVSKKIKPYMIEQALLDDRPANYVPEANEMRCDVFEELIRTNPAAFYGPRTNVFYARPATPGTSAPVIREAQLRMLRDMAEIFQRKQTDYHVVISPLYDQMRLAAADLAALQQVFGAGRVHDYSGKNAFTEAVTNYYESSHYRPHVARAILADIYNNHAAAVPAQEQPAQAQLKTGGGL